MNTYAPSPRQLQLIRSLAEERNIEGFPESLLSPMTSAQASEAIDRLFKLPKKAAPTPGEVPAGRYAVKIDGALRFYLVDHGTGRWAGKVFVSRQSSDEIMRISLAEQQKALKAIRSEPEAALVRYGRELGVCGVCGRALTDESSREAGIGPVCTTRI